MKGICGFNLIAVRFEGSDKSEMVTQLLFGDVYTVISESENGKWLKIEIQIDGYQGWIDKKLHLPINSSIFEEITNLETFYCAEVVGYLEVEGAKQPIFFGSFLPQFDGKYVYLNDQRFPFTGKADKVQKTMSTERLLNTARSFLSTPYLWGGKSHAGIDCSGLTQMVFRSCGHHLMRDAYQQISMGAHVESLEKAKSGDLAFFANDAGRTTHVGILLENEKIIHAHGKVRIDRLDQTGIINGDSGLYSHRLNGIRRIMG